MDTLAYFGGRRFGKRKFLPNISPNKTIEGFLIAIVLVPIIYSALFSFNFNISIFILFSLFFITSLFSVLGDAVASLFKRVAGVKDASNLIPGHGGVFDRIDSHLAAVPIFIIFLWTMTGTGM
jgi:phosphatidate cytidylyltransferase